MRSVDLQGALAYLSLGVTRGAYVTVMVPGGAPHGGQRLTPGACPNPTSSQSQVPSVADDPTWSFSTAGSESRGLFSCSALPRGPLSAGAEAPRAAKHREQGRP